MYYICAMNESENIANGIVKGGLRLGCLYVVFVIIISATILFASIMALT